MKRYVAGALTGAILLAGAAFWLWWLPVGTSGQAAGLPPVLRSPEQTVQLLSNAAVRLRVFNFEFGDAWVEPGCQGAAVFLRTDEGPVWAWYDLQRENITERLSMADVLPAVQQEVAVETNRLSWQPQPDGPGMRLRFPVGYTDSGELVLLRLRTEECTILSGFLETTRDPEKPGRQTEITFTPQPQEDYTNQWQTDAEVPRFTAETKPALQAALDYTGVTESYFSNSWIEPRCNMAVVDLRPVSETAGYWVLWDLNTEEIVETLTRQQVVELLRREVPDLTLFEDKWIHLNDAPGRRSRHLVGFTDLDMVYLHLNTRNCSLQPLRLQLAADAADMGRFIDLPVVESAPEL